MSSIFFYYICSFVALMVIGVVWWAVWRVRAEFDREDTNPYTIPEGMTQLLCYEFSVCCAGGVGYMLFFNY